MGYANDDEAGHRTRGNFNTTTSKRKQGTLNLIWTSKCERRQDKISKGVNYIGVVTDLKRTCNVKTAFVKHYYESVGIFNDTKTFA